jgi:hypothetical protein
VAWVAVYIPLSTLIFPAWFNFARESAGALGLFLGVQALGGVLGGLVFAALLGTGPGSAAAVALSFGVGLVGPGPCRSSTPPTTRAPPRSCWAGSTAPPSRWS